MSLNQSLYQISGPVLYSENLECLLCPFAGHATVFSHLALRRMKCRVPTMGHTWAVAHFAFCLAAQVYKTHVLGLVFQDLVQ